MNANGRWAGGDAYERYIGRWSRPVGAAFVDWLDVAPDRAWLDLGCGTGGLTATVLERAEPGRVIGVDPSASFVEHARAHVIDPRAAFVVGSADALPIDDDSVDVAVSGLVLNFVPDVTAALRGLRRVVRPDGLIGAYVWDYAGRMDLIRRFWDAAVGLDPGARELDEGVRFPICAPDALRAAFVSAGLSDVDVRAIDAPTRFADVDDLWTPFLSGVGPAPGYVAGLPGDARAALRERLLASLPVGADGSIELVARAWAVQGRS